MTHQTEVERRAASDGATRASREILAAGISPAAFSVDEFCAAHRISRALFYLLQKQGTGPRLMRVGRRTLVTADSAGEWRHRMENATRKAP